MRLVGELIFLMYLACCAIRDVRQHIIPTQYAIAGGVFCLIYRMLFWQDPLWPWIWGGILGCGFLLFSIVSGQKFGCGDSLIIILIGIILGLKKLIYVLIISFSVAFLYGVFLLIIKNKKLKDVFAFTPNLTIGYMMVLLWVYFV